MLGKFIKIDNEQMPNPNPGTFAYRYNPDENVFKSEAGTELSNIRRLNRISWSAAFNCTSTLKEKLETMVLKPSVEVSIDNGTAISGRLRLGSDISLVEDSEYLSATQGLWVVPLVFEGE